MTNTTWLSEGTIIGAAGQDWTPTTIAVGTRTNSLYLWARSFIDSDGDGLPDWWEMQNGLDPNSADTGNTGIPDAYKQDAYGWTMIYKYEHGYSSSQVIPPAAPSGLMVVYRPAASQVTVSWNPSPGPVTGYLLERYIPQLNQTNFFQIPAGATSYNDSALLSTTVDPQVPPPTYRIKTYYSPSESGWSDWVSLYEFNDSFDADPTAQLIQGPRNHLYIALRGLPQPVGAANLIMYGGLSVGCGNSLSELIHHKAMTTRTRVICGVILGICILIILWPARRGEPAKIPSNPDTKPPPVAEAKKALEPEHPSRAPEAELPAYATALARSMAATNPIAGLRLAWWQAPIDFYGKVVDEHSNAVSEATVAFHWVEVPDETGNRNLNTQSDAADLFSLQGAHGPT